MTVSTDVNALDDLGQVEYGIVVTLPDTARLFHRFSQYVATYMGYLQYYNHKGQAL
jgi:hypothetical protein